MRRMTSIVVCAGSLIAGQVGAAPAASDPVATARRALAAHDFRGAGIAYNDAIEARLPGRGVSRPDPVLDRLYLDVLAAGGGLPFGITLLQRLVADPGTPDRDHYRLLLATYNEWVASFDQAEQQYRALAADARASTENRLAATLGIARIQMMADPVAAISTLQAIDRATAPKGKLWEIDLLLAC